MTPALLITRYDGMIQDAVAQHWPDYPYWKAWKAQLAAESALDPAAVSPTGALGLAQFLPSTWAEIAPGLGYQDFSPHDPGPAIHAGAFYMAEMRRAWTAARSPSERHWLGVASYTVGLGAMLAAQSRCNGALLWRDITRCLASPATDRHLDRVWAYWQELDAL